MPGLLPPMSTGVPERQRRARAAVGVGRGAGARAVGGLAEVDVRAVVEDEVGGALRTGREGLHAGVDRGAGRGRPAGRRRGRTGHDRAGEDCEREGLQQAVLHRRLYLLEYWGAPWYPVTKGSDRTCGGHAKGTKRQRRTHPRCPPPPLPASWLEADVSSFACGSAIRPESAISSPMRRTSTSTTCRPGRSSSWSATILRWRSTRATPYVVPAGLGHSLEVLEPAIVVEAIGPCDLLY